MAENSKPYYHKTHNDLTAKYVRSILDYNPETGDFFWKFRTDVGKRWNSLYAGKKAGCLDHFSHEQISINSKKYLSHRLAYLLMMGEWPDQEMDHINGIPNDNRWENLRNITHSQNMMNSKITSRNTSGYRGVSWHKGTQRWCANIKIDGKQICLGYFKEKKEAAQKYEAASSFYYGEFARK